MHNRSLRYASAPILLLVSALITAPAAPCAWAQEKPIYSFTGGADGNFPESGVIIDKLGNIYGTTVNGGNLPSCEGFGCGSVFELTRTAGGRWKEITLYDFAGGTTDGSQPVGALLLDAHGHLFGITISGGTGTCVTGVATCGTVFELVRNGSSGWTETVLYSFQGGSDGASPVSGLISDAAGNLYGTTREGGGASGADCAADGCGTVFELSPNSDGSWSEKVLYSFLGGSDGASPQGSLVSDRKGNLFGVTYAGGSTPCYYGVGCGTVFELQHGSSGWIKSTIYQFVGGSDGMFPDWTLTLDASGNLYGTTEFGGGFVLIFGYGTVFELSPVSGESWSETVLYRFTGEADGGIPASSVIFDPAGNLYGTSTAGGTSGVQGYGGGTVFKLTKGSSGSWTETTLHAFVNGPPDGQSPEGQLVRSQNGGLIGATFFGGTSTNPLCGAGCGTVFEINP